MSIGCWFLRALLALRYRIMLRGMELLTPDLKKGSLFLMNHPSMIEPLILSTLLWPKFKIRPVGVEYIFRMAFLQPIIKRMKGVSIPNCDFIVNEYKAKKTLCALDQIVDGLKNGDNFLIAPSGSPKSQGKEVLKGNSAVHTILQKCPNANIVLIRVTGLWGSTFSRVFTGTVPNLMEVFFDGFKTLLKNGLFFAPRRKVFVEVEANPLLLPRSGSRIELNRYLENWFNQYVDGDGVRQETEPLNLVPYHFFTKKVLKPVCADLNEQKLPHIDRSFPEEIVDEIYKELRRILKDPFLSIKPKMHLGFDLGMDSLNIAELITYLVQHFRMSTVSAEELATVEDILMIVTGKRVIKKTANISTVMDWKNEANRPEFRVPDGETLPEVFLNACRRMGSFSACGDDAIGILSYKKLKQAVFILAEYFRTIPESHVGVLLPGSVATMIVILALQCVGKVPVMLNWTLGSSYLNKMIEITNTKKVISSWKFLDKVPNVQFGNLIDQIEFLEDIKRKISFRIKLKGLFLSCCSPKKVLEHFKLENLSSDQSSIILFTSGSESLPKCVPLSHKNILASLHAVSALFIKHFKQDEKLLSCLPPFHTMGLVCTGLFPLFSGMRVGFYPDPKASMALAERIDRWKITIFLAPPFYVQHLLNAAQKSQLLPLRFILSGSEKVPSELYDQIEAIAPGAKLYEGYGLTESNIVSMNNPDTLQKKGLGKIINSLDVCVVHPETLVPLSPGSEGEICLHGPSVFDGYLGNVPSPFIELVSDCKNRCTDLRPDFCNQTVNQKKWFRTGDLGYLDQNRTLVISGRFKRFIKLGGEMISLGVIEEILKTELIKSNQNLSTSSFLAICADEKSATSPQIVLFTTIDVDKEKANEILRAASLSNLFKISKVQKIESIPVFDTGKINYYSLQKLLNNLINESPS